MQNGRKALGMSHTLRRATVLVWAVSLQTADASTLSVVDEAGKPIAQFDAMFHTADHGYTNWTAGRDGRVEIRGVSSDFRGQVVFVEFWSITCGPCQPAMNKLNRLAAEHATDWRDRVAVVPVSIDDTREAAAAHVASRGWTALRHFWSGGEETGMKSPVARDFVIDAIPVAFLIDSDGRVVWRGNPRTDDGDLEDRIERLLAR